MWGRGSSEVASESDAGRGGDGRQDQRKQSREFALCETIVAISVGFSAIIFAALGLFIGQNLETIVHEMTSDVKTVGGDLMKAGGSKAETSYIFEARLLVSAVCFVGYLCVFASALAIDHIVDQIETLDRTRDRVISFGGAYLFAALVLFAVSFSFIVAGFYFATLGSNFDINEFILWSVCLVCGSVGVLLRMLTKNDWFSSVYIFTSVGFCFLALVVGCIEPAYFASASIDLNFVIGFYMLQAVIFALWLFFRNRS